MIIFQNAKKPIAFLFPRLSTLDAVEAALREKFGNRTPAIITKLKMRHPWGTKSWTPTTSFGKDGYFGSMEAAIIYADVMYLT